LVNLRRVGVGTIQKGIKKGIDTEGDFDGSTFGNFLLVAALGRFLVLEDTIIDLYFH